MSDHVYRLSEIVGSSQTSVDDAIRTAIRKAGQTVRHIEWFETKEIRGQVVDGDVNYFQVRLSIGFRVEDKQKDPVLPTPSQARGGALDGAGAGPLSRSCRRRPAGGGSGARAAPARCVRPAAAPLCPAGSRPWRPGARWSRP